MRTVQTLHDRQQKMATAELGHRDVFGLKLGPGGRRAAGLPGAQRPRRRAHRARHRRRDRRIDATARCWRRRFSSSTSCAARRRRSTCRANPTSARRSRPWLTERAGRRVRIVVPQRGEKRGFVDLANRNAALAYQTRFNQAQTAQHDALETLQHVLALPALPRRIECFDISTIQGSETVASMVVCEDGRMRRASIASSGSGLQWSSQLGIACEFRISSAPRPESQTTYRMTLRRCTRSFSAAIAKLLEQGGPFPDLIADRRRQGAAVGGVCGARGARAREPRRRRHRQEGGAAVHARSRGSDRAARPTIRRCCWSSGSATRRTGSRSRSTAARERCATCDPSSTTCRASARAGGRRC